MPGSDQTVKVTLVAVSGPLVKGMSEASSATAKLGKDIDGTSAKSKGMESSLAGSSAALKGMAVGAAAVAGTALVAFLRDTVRAAGDLEQSVGGVDAVFGSAAQQVHDFGTSAADSVGLSRNAFNELATVTGALLKNSGIKDFADQTLVLTQRAADVSATFGGTAKDAVEAFNSALKGEYNPIEKYGVKLSEASVNAALAAKGLDKLKGSALEQAKAQERVNLIMDQTSAYAGRFASEANTLQGQQQRLTAEWENAKAALGQALLPALTQVTDAMRSGVSAVVATAEAWNSLPGPVQGAVVAVAALIALRGPLNGLVADVGARLPGMMHSLGASLGEAYLAAEKAGGGFRGAAAGAQSLTGGMGRFNLTAADAAIVTVAAAAGAVQLAQALSEVEQVDPAGLARDLEALGTSGGTLATFGQLFNRGAFASDVISSAEALERFGASAGNVLDQSWDAKVDRLTSFGVPAKNFADQVAQIDAQLAAMVNSGNIDGAANAYERLTASVATWSAESGRSIDMNELAGKFTNYSSALDRAAGGNTNLSGAALSAAAATKQQEDAATAAASALKQQAAAALEVVSAQLAASNSAIAYQQASASVADVVAQIQSGTEGYAATLDITTEAGRRNQSALNDLAAAALRVAEDNIRAGQSTDSVKASMDGARQGFIAAAVAMGISEAQAQSMASQFGLTGATVDALGQKVTGLPASKNINITASTSQAMSALDGIQAKLQSIQSKNVTLTVSRVYSGGSWENVGQFATGGAVYGPGTSTSDSIPARLSNGEYVVKAAAVDKYGLHFMDRVNSMRLASGGSVGGGSRGGDSAPLDPATIRAALDGTTLRLGPVDSITREVTAQLVTAYSRSV